MVPVVAAAVVEIGVAVVFVFVDAGVLSIIEAVDVLIHVVGGVFPVAV